MKAYGICLQLLGQCCASPSHFNCFFTLLPAQTFYGSIVGTVTDNSGAIVPNATVTIANLGTNEKRTEKTNGASEYRFVNLVPDRSLHDRLA